MSGDRVLIVDDEPAIVRTLRANLAARGYEVVSVESGEEALLESEAHRPDIVILDLMLPGISGIDVTAALRARSSVPILVLSARGEEDTKVRALDLGADDYLTKPFGIDELLARVRALLRRLTTEASADGLVRVGPLELDAGARQVLRDGVPVELTPREFDVLAFLMRHAGKVVTHRVLLQQIWGPEYGFETQYLRVFVNRLRHKIEADPSHPRLIVTEPGVGYRILPPSA
ncbi:MAG TPA: response regulator transcription factor [Chloroflexota bacterium]|jgi:two-component system KDP operon response regulator KdpE|nr:response regulator transcription factor [Chloroflexota bacterium]